MTIYHLKKSCPHKRICKSDITSNLDGLIGESTIHATTIIFDLMNIDLLTDKYICNS